MKERAWWGSFYFYSETDPLKEVLL